MTLLFKVTLRVTWPWHTRSPLIVTVWNYIYLTFATLKTCKTKKDHHSSVTRIRDKKGHVQGHVTLIYKVTLDNYNWNHIYFDIRDPRNLQNKKDHHSSVTRTRDKKGHAQGHVTLTHRVTLDGYSVDLCPFEFYKQNYIQNSSKIISVADPGFEIGTVMWKLLWKSAWPWISR